jgi:adenine-specific DNA-methyltransferase
MEIEKLDLGTLNIVEEQKAKLKVLFPEVFTEGNKIDFERLKSTLGEEVDTGKERYGMNWPGKSECFKILQQPSIATLVPCPEESVNFDTTENLFIEGDNLEVLKLLQKSYLGKIKMIYIDPPYNTGNEFIYPDNYTESLETYLSYTGQIDDEGRKFSTNTETEGRFHSRWLNMMYPRLFLAKNLLRDDGVIFISIDDNEVDNLKKVCNEIFGEENFESSIIVQSNKRGQTYKNIAKTHEYILIYTKTSDAGIGEFEKSVESLHFEDSKGKFDWWELRNRNPKFGKRNRPNLYFPIYISTVELDESGYSKVSVKKQGTFTVEVFPKNSEGEDSCWRWGKDKLVAEDISSKTAVVVAKQKKNGEWNVYQKSRKSSTKAKSIWDDTGVISEQGTIQLGELGLSAFFDHPKPLDLIKKSLQIGTNDSDIILDFFSGSATTAHAILDFNHEDRGNRKFICVQLPEPTDPKSEAYKAGYKTIADIGKERLRRVIKKINHENKDKLKFEENTIDLGFKVFKLAPSNFKVWNAAVEKNTEAIERQLFDYIDHISHVSREDAILYEILLKSGFELSTKVEKLDLAGKTVYSIAHGALLVCLEKNLTKELFRAIAEKKPARCVCLDKGFQNDDQLKTNAVQTMKDKGVEFRTV